MTLDLHAGESHHNPATGGSPAEEFPYWRGLEELSGTPEFIDSLRREFPRQASELKDPESRRTFLKLMASSIGLAGIGLSGCMRQPDEQIVPNVRQPADRVPGKAQFYATCSTLGGYARGILVESHEGRPTKIEGNPEHPASMGATDIFGQASILGMYDPDRSQDVRKAGLISTWGEFSKALTAQLAKLRGKKGEGLAILTETVTSPTLATQLRELLRELPSARWFQYEPAGRDNVRAGAKLAFGEYVETVYHFGQATIVLSLDAEFLTGMPGSLRYAREFTDRRRFVAQPKHFDSGEVSIDGSHEFHPPMNRLYAAESTPGLVGATADHRLRMKAADVEGLARAVAAELGIKVAENATTPGSVPADWLAAVVEDLKSHPGQSLVIAGEGQPAVVHALVHAINQKLENVGKTVEYTAPVEAEPVDQLASLTELVELMRGDKVQALILLGGNPLYSAPAGLEFAKAFDRVSFRAHLAQDYNETSFAAHWHLPEAHELECWGDARAFDGTASIQQPLIAPLYSGRSPVDLLAMLRGHPEWSTYELVQRTWKQALGEEGFEAKWRRAVHDGVIAGTKAEAKTPALKFVDADRTPASRSGLELTFGPDPTVGDGRFANSGWLQELPKPLTKLTWDNALLISPTTAKRLNFVNEDLVELVLGGKSLRAAVWILPGQPDDSVSLAWGYGRTHSGRIGTGPGVNAYQLRPSHQAWFSDGLELRATGTKHPLAVTQTHHSMEGRDLIHKMTLKQATEGSHPPSHVRQHPEHEPTLYHLEDPSAAAWGMVIDQTTCIGCNACVIACQSENNIPIVGKEQVRIGREMHWLRIDRYYRGPIESPETNFQPVMCVHCENAPCELVCPVAATLHSHEGLNQMVYNRCVGTRYCSNNCPYKVRRFNFLDYSGELGLSAVQAPSLSLMHNPDVTVRSRGVMEKCTYCVQRIQEKKIDAQIQNRDVRDGEIQTACQQACPASAILFGNIRDKNSQVAQLRQSPLNYSLLGELNTLPRTTHLSRVQNPHPDLPMPAKNDTLPLNPTLLDEIGHESEGQKPAAHAPAGH